MIDNYFYILGLIWFIVIFGVISLMFLKSRSTIRSEYSLKSDFLTPAETNFYRILENALDDMDYKIFAKVRLADLFNVTSRGRSYTIGFNKIRSKHVDFLICDKNIKPLLAIELDDKTHLTNKKTIFSDKLKDLLFNNDTLPLIRINAKHEYNLHEIKESILNKSPSTL